jgi:ParB-like chromosome segregation protein Spo0J
MDVIIALRRGDLTYSHARVLLALHDESQISKVAQKAIKDKLSVIALDDLVLEINVPNRNDCCCGPNDKGPSSGP